MNCVESTRVESHRVAPENEQHCVQWQLWQVMSCGQCRGEAPAFLARQLGSMAASVFATQPLELVHTWMFQKTNPTTCKGNWPLISCLAGGFVSSCCVDPCKGAMHRNQQNKSPYQTLSYLSNSFALRHCPGKDLREFAS